MTERNVDDGHIFNISRYLTIHTADKITYLFSRQHSLVIVICIPPSMSGHRVLGDPSGHFYAATKFALTALTEGTRQELRGKKSHIRVTVSNSRTVTPPPPKK